MSQPTQEEYDLLSRRFEREKRARAEAEQLLEVKSREIFQVNQELKSRGDQLVEALEKLDHERAKQVHEAYLTGISESAVTVFHNIGNAITPLVANIDMHLDELEKDNIPQLLKKLQESLSHQLTAGTLEQYLWNDAKGKQILPFIVQLAEALKERRDREKEYLTEGAEQLAYISRVISFQRKYYQRKESEAHPFLLMEIWTDVTDMMIPALQQRKVNVVAKSLIPDLKLTGFSGQMAQVLTHLIRNAIEAIDKRHQQLGAFQPEITFTIQTINQTDRFLLEDNGIGLSEEFLGQILKSGFTTKKDKAGYGLMDCQRFVKNMGGTLKIYSDGIGKGTKVELCFPRSESMANGSRQ